MEERDQPEKRLPGMDAVDDHQRVRADVVGVETVLLDAEADGDLGEEPGHRARRLPLRERARGEPALREGLRQLVADALAGEARDAGDVACDRCAGRGVVRQIEARRESERAQHPQVVFGKSAIRIADSAENAAFEVVTAAEGVAELAGQGIPGDRVDREVATRKVFVERHAEANIGVSAVGGYVGAKGGHLDRLVGLLARPPCRARSRPGASARRAPARAPGGRRSQRPSHRGCRRAVGPARRRPRPKPRGRPPAGGAPRRGALHWAGRLALAFIESSLSSGKCIRPVPA